MMRSWLLLVMGLALGCSASDAAGGGDDYVNMMPDDLPAPGCDTTGGEDCSTTTSLPTPSNCDNSSECPGGWNCLAPFDNETKQKGELQCRPICVENNDQVMWCVDDQACCNPDATCTTRGLCVGPERGTTSGGSSDSGDGTSSSSSSSSSSGSGSSTAS